MSVFEDIFGAFTIGVKDPVRVNDHGNQTVTYLDEANRVIPGCDVQTGNTVEDSANRDGVMIEYTVYAPADADLPDDALVVYDGQDFEIVGVVRLFVDTFGTTYRTALLRKWAG